MLEPWVQQLTKEMELEGSLATQVAGVFVLPLEENVTVTMTERPLGYSHSCTLCPVPKRNEEAGLTRIMQGNLFGQGTAGAVLGISPEGTHLTLAQTIDYNGDYKEFKDRVADFTNTVDFWLEEMKRYL